MSPIWLKKPLPAPESLFQSRQKVWIGASHMRSWRALMLSVWDPINETIRGSKSCMKWRVNTASNLQGYNAVSAWSYEQVIAGVCRSKVNTRRDLVQHQGFILFLRVFRPRTLTHARRKQRWAGPTPVEIHGPAPFVASLFRLIVPNRLRLTRRWRG